MSADQIAEIAPMIREVLDAPAEANLCATFEVVGNDDAWAQVTPRSINVAYPSNEAPEVRLAAHLASLPCVGISDWEPMRFATFTYMPDRPQVIARFVDCLLADLFRLGDYSVNANLQEL
jgi:hypothetical protein